MSKKYSEFTEEEKEEYKAKMREYYEKHKEERKAKDKKYRETHKEEIREYNKKYHEAHKEKAKETRRKHRKNHPLTKEQLEKQNEFSIKYYYERKNEFHGLNIQQCYYRYYKGRKMSRYFSSFENYASFLLNPDVKLKLNLINNMRLGKISEQDALVEAGIPLTEEDKEYIREYVMKYRPRKKE